MLSLHPYARFLPLLAATLWAATAPGALVSQPVSATVATAAIEAGFEGTAAYAVDDGARPAKKRDAVRSRAASAEIPATELLARRHSDAYTAVRSLRPLWFVTRGSTAAAVQVYLDGVHIGSAESLRSLNLATVSTISRLGSAAATNRFGQGHGSGAILVTTG
jgi:hypothetical protein